MKECLKCGYIKKTGDDDNPVSSEACPKCHTIYKHVDAPDNLKPLYHPDNRWAMDNTYKLGMRMLCSIIAGVFLIWGGIVWIIQDRKEFEISRNENIQTDATVTDKESSDKAHLYFIDYQFEISKSNEVDNKRFSKKEAVSEAVYDSVKPGQSVPIFYPPEDPNLSHLNIEEDSRPDNIIPPILGIFILLISIGYIKIFLKAKELDKKGIITQGRITDRWMGKNMLGKVSYFIAYQFGEDFRVTQRVEAPVYQYLLNRDTVEIVYLPRDPAGCSRMRT